ncbi:post-GPI attachment to proteins factor 6 [Bicyclus anynana]|uniref:Post-GPI attachment to proteins factor 6 n=1 Tax=Bicyclus anynana TaxID=110368 RepID=A0A6J1MT62_BICAN|nr:post-GPI attachment to proteins factor 6 [Bicyclus anynana]
MRYVCLLLFCICYVATGDNEDEMEYRRRRIIEQLVDTRPAILPGYQLVTRHVGVDVFMYRTYRTVAVVFYPVANDLSDARFTFQCEELHLNNIGSCSPQEVVIHLKRGSYPAVNPDGYDFPKTFLNPALREETIHTLELLSDGTNTTYSIQSPKSGIWYALAYIKWQDPRAQKVEQQGLVADCHTILYTDLQIKPHDPVRYLNCYKSLTVDYDELPVQYKCLARDGLEPIKLDVNVINNTISNAYITVKVQSNSPPTENDYILYCKFPSQNKTQMVMFHTHPKTHHYIQLDVNEGNGTDIKDCESYDENNFDENENRSLTALMRDDQDRFFTFAFGLPTTDLQDVTSLINLTASEIKVLRFEVNQFLDIGGSLAIESSLIIMSKGYYGGYKRERVKGTLLGFTEDNQFFKVVICLNIGHASIPLQSGFCRFNDKLTPALFVLNSTDSDSIYDKMIIPYPEGGLWYLTMRLFCDKVVCPCPTSADGTKYYVGTTEKDSDDLSTFSNVTRDGVTACNTTVLLSLSSASCVSGKCSNHGNCGLNTFSGLVMSFCSCSAGYGGWDCSDESRVDSLAYMLVSVFLLTLSNLLFFFSIYVATIRLYYVEAVMYAFTMLFSTFYHACDAPAQVAYCIMRGNILQFGDFYCGLMSFWVTLLAMSIIGLSLKSFLQIIGAIVIALLTTWNMHSIVSFLLPVAFGAVVMLISWYVDYRKTRFFRYPKSYYSIYMPLGLVLVSVGLICYAFLQTEQNYKIVHSLWHMIIAVSVVFLLPDVRRRASNPFVPNRECLKSPFYSYFRRSRPQSP